MNKTAIEDFINRLKNQLRVIEILENNLIMEADYSPDSDFDAYFAGLTATMSKIQEEVRAFEESVKAWA